MNLKKQENLALMMAMMTETMVRDEMLFETPYIIHRNDVPKLHKPKHKGNSIIVPVRTTPKVGANAPCPCGSGKKNKKCCKMSALPKIESNENN
jgi:uncharacterized protein YecA (UPF0149 family)